MKKIAALSCLIVLGLMAGAPAASARERTFSYTYDYGSYPRPGVYSNGRISYDRDGYASWEEGRGSRSSRDYGSGTRHQDGPGYRSQGGSGSRDQGGSSRNSCSSALGRISYDRDGTAHWESDC